MAQGRWTRDRLGFVQWSVRLKPQESDAMDDRVAALGFSSRAEYLRRLVLADIGLHPIDGPAE